MASHVKQHFIPRFLLDEWAGVDGKLGYFRWEGDRLLYSRGSAKAVGKEAHLYSLRRQSGEPDVQIERDFLGPKLDDLAAPIHRQLLKSESLSHEQEVVWSRFLRAQIIRTPSAVEFARRNVPRLKREHAHARSLANAAAAGAGDFALTVELGDDEDVGMHEMLRIIQSDQFDQRYIAGRWSVLTLECGEVDLLLTDNPVMVMPSLATDGYALTLPISPRKLFLCFMNGAGFGSWKRGDGREFAKAVNRNMVGQADRLVYVTDEAHERLVKKHLQRALTEVARK